MVAVFTGLGAGVARGSGSTLGGAGLLGSASSGRAGENLMVNAATGNLVITRQDEFLTGRAADFGVSRTYNSLAEVHDGDNGDKWQLSTVRKVFGLTGTANASGSTIKRQAGDGSVVTYTWGTRGGVTAYWTTEGDGAHDKIHQNGSGQWVWTDGASQVSEVYEAIPGDATAHRILRQVDTLGQTLEFTYHDTTRLYRVTSGNGEYVQYAWNGSQVAAIDIGITDHATGLFRQVNRTYYTYDGSGRLSSVKIDLSPDAAGISDGHTYSISYEYGANGLVSAVTQTDGSRTEIAYDSAGRVYQLTERASSTDARVTTFGYAASYTDVTAPNGQTTRFEYAGAQANTATWDWTVGGATKEIAEPIDGQTAVKYTVIPGGWAAASYGLYAVPGQTMKFTASLKAVAGSATEQLFGLYGDSTGWGGGRSSARIISGPGQIEQWDGGLWGVTGLSSTEATRIEVLRTYTTAESGGAFIYVDQFHGTRVGQQLIVSGAALEELSEVPVFVDVPALSWPNDGVSAQAGGTVGGAPAALFTSSPGVDWSAAYVAYNIRRGETFKFTVNLQAVPGHATEQGLGLYSDHTSWPDGGRTHARIVSGPGTLTRENGGLWRISGLSDTQATKIEIIRTHDRDETGGAYIYTDIFGGFRDGQQLLVSAPTVTKLNDYAAIDRQLTRIIAPPAYGGAPQQTQTFEYDADGNLTKSTAPSGAVTHYQYNAMGNVTLIDKPVGADVARIYDAGNRLVQESTTGSDETSNSATFYTAYAYSSTGMLRYKISSAERVTEYRYDGYGRLSAQIEYTEHAAFPGQAINEALMDGWRDSQGDKTKRAITNYTYDLRGNLSSSAQYAAADASGTAITADGFQATYYTYDHLGRLLATHGYGETGESYLYDGLDRVIASSSPTSGVTTVFFDDAQTRTVMHLSSGLNRTLTYNKSGDLISEVESAVGVQTPNLAPDQSSWLHERVTRTSVSPIAGNPAYRYVTDTAVFGAIYTHATDVAAGETVRWRVALKSDGTTSIHQFGLYGTSEGWGSNASDTQTVVVSGPGRVSQLYGGLLEIDGLSASEETTIEVVRTFAQAQWVGPFFYLGGTSGMVSAGTGVIISAQSLTWAAADSELAFSAATSDSYDKLGRLRVSYDAFDSGNRTYFVYDNAGRKTAEINNYHGMTEFVYDADNRLVATYKYYNVVGSLDALLDPNNTVTVAELRPAEHVYDLRSWTIYDAGGRVVQTIDGTGAVTGYEYDDAGRVVRSTLYGNRVSLSGFATSPPGSPVSVSANPAIDAVTRTFYDRDGHIRGLLDGEGYLTQYLYDAAGRKIEEIRYPAAVDVSVRSGGSLVTLIGYADPGSVHVRRTRFVYDGQGQLRYQVDAQNQVTSYSYNTAGKLIGTRVHSTAISVGSHDFATVKAAVTTHANDRVTSLTLDAAGRVVASQDAAGTYTYYTYDAAGNVKKVRHGSNSATEQITRNWYDARGNLRFSVDPAGLLTKYNYTVGGRLSAEMLYDAPVSVGDSTTIAQVAALAVGGYTEKGYEYDNLGRIVREIDGSGSFKHYTYYSTGLWYVSYVGYDSAWGTQDRAMGLTIYDGAGHVFEKWSAYGESEVTMLRFDYDARGNQTRMTDGRGNFSYATYDRRGLLKTTTDGAGGVTQYEYNAFGEVARIVDARGNQAALKHYDTLGRVVQADDGAGATYHTYNRFGELASTTRASATTQFQYDKMGRVTLITDALSFTESFAYNEVGDRVSATNKLGGTTTYVYDRRGLLVSETLPMNSVNQEGTILASTVTNTYQYDSRGNLTQETRAAGLAEQAVTQYVYDRANRLIEQIDPTFHGYTPRTYFAYDARGNLTRKTDPNGYRTVYFYDDLDRVTVEINAVGTYTSYIYDANGNVTDTRVYAAAVSIPADGGAQEEAPPPSGDFRQTTFTYDAANRMLTSAVHGAYTGSYDGATFTGSWDALTTQYQYDANGNVIKTIDPNGNATWAYYDAMNRKWSQVDGAGYRTDWTYDANGNVTREWRYAAQGALPDTSYPSWVPGDNYTDRATDYTYDLMGNRLTEIRLYVKIHDGAGGHTYDHSAIYYQYNGLGQVTRKQQATGDAIVYQYDNAGRLTQESKSQFHDYYTGVWVTPTVQYAYDGLGNLTRTRQIGAGDAADRVTKYGYTGGKLQWVQDAEYTDGNTADGKQTNYWYDMAGNLQYEYYTRHDSSGGHADAKAFEGVFRVYDGLGRAVQQWNVVHDASGWAQTGPTTTTSFNAYGEVIGLQVGAAVVQQSQYDKAGRLVGSNAGDGAWKYFSYDKSGNRTGAIVSTGADIAGLSFGLVHGIGGTAVTYTRYDGRNLATHVYEPNRELSTSSSATLLTQRSYNAFGDVTALIAANGAQTGYVYNSMGRLVRINNPTVTVVGEDGNSVSMQPTEDFYYDLGGRLTAQRDANGNLTRYSLLTNTGYDGSQALIRDEYHADGGQKSITYDVHGDARMLIDEMGRYTYQYFDKMGRVTVVNHGASGLLDYYQYDGLGQQLRHYNNYYGSGDAEVTDYDVQGRVISSRALGGDVTTTSYAWEVSAGTATALGSFGGWVTTVSTAADRASGADGIVAAVARSDLFGRTVFRSDMSGVGYDYTYDIAGRLVEERTAGTVGNAGKRVVHTYYNTGLVRTTFSGDVAAANTTWQNRLAEFEYGALGALTSEKLTLSQGSYEEGRWIYVGGGFEPPFEPEDPNWQWIDASYSATSMVVQDGDAEYDAAGRMTRYVAHASGGADLVDKRWSYDAGGNVRAIVTDYRAVAMDAGTTHLEHWYRYDALNRVVLSQGVLSGGTIVAGTRGISLSYDAAGRRATSQTGAGPLESYAYDANDLVTSVTIGGVARVASSYDALGRLVGHLEKDASGNAVYERYDLAYNSRGQLLKERGRQKQGADWHYTHTVNHYSATGTGSAPAAISGLGSTGSSSGAVLYYSETKNWLNGSASPAYLSSADYDLADSYASFAYEWTDPAGAGGPRQTGQVLTNRDGTTSSTHRYNDAGYLTSVLRSGTSAYTGIALNNDIRGLVISRSESGAGSAPSSSTYRFGGREMGTVGNDGTANVDYATTIARRDDVGTGHFRGGATTGSAFAEFDANHKTLAGGAGAGGAGSYTVQAGDTLQGIALGVWGDAGLWYKLAEANGLSGMNGLAAGQRLTIPPGVVGNHHTTTTLAPYDPVRALGDIGPTPANPPKTTNGCGAFGQILLTVVAVAVSALLPVVAPATFGGVLGGALAGAAGSLVSQGVGVATGIQDKFDFGGVALAALGGGVGGALRGAGDVLAKGALGGATSAANDAIRGVLGSVLTQGIGTATGLQSKFSWAGVAAAGIGAGIGGAAARGLGQTSGFFATGVGNDIAATSAAAISMAATRSAIDGSSFGDALRASLPDAIGQAVGRAVAGAVVDGLRGSATSAAVAAATGGGKSLNTTPLAHGLAKANGQMAANPVAANAMGATVGEGMAAAVEEASAGSFATAGLPDAMRRYQQGGQSPNWEVHNQLQSGVDLDRITLAAQGINEDFGRVQAALDYDASLLRQRDINEFLASTLFMDMPSTSVAPSGAKTFASGISARERGELANLQSASAVLSAVGAAGSWLYRSTVGPDTLVGKYLIKPANIVFYGGAGVIANSPAGDLGMITTMQTSGVGMIPGAGLSAIRTIAQLGGTLKVSRAGPLSIEAQFQANSLRLADDGHDIFTQGVANGDIVLNSRLSMEIQRGRFVDEHIRDGNILLRGDLGLDASTVRINQRLYTPNGKYTVPDIHFPGSGNSIDYSYQLKTATTLQITRIQQAVPNGTITIVPPAAVRPVYVIR